MATLMDSWTDRWGYSYWHRQLDTLRAGSTTPVAHGRWLSVNVPAPLADLARGVPGVNPAVPGQLGGNDDIYGLCRLAHPCLRPCSCLGIRLDHGKHPCPGIRRLACRAPAARLAAGILGVPLPAPVCVTVPAPVPVPVPVRGGAPVPRPLCVLAPLNVLAFVLVPRRLRAPAPQPELVPVLAPQPARALQRAPAPVPAACPGPAPAPVPLPGALMTVGSAFAALPPRANGHTRCV